MSLLRTLMCALALLPPLAALAQEPDAASGPGVAAPVISPDGKRMLFVSDAGVSQDIWIANRDGSDARPLINWGDSEEIDPEWSPDGSAIAFASTRGGGRFNIWLTDANGGNLRQLTSNAGDNRQPRYAPTGAALAFVSNRTGKRELWRMAANGDGQLALGLISQHISDPSWSPDGTEIVYTGCLNDACNLYALSVDGSRARQLTSGNFNDWQADWSAFGIVFASDRGDAQGLWLVNANGANLRALTTPVGTGDLYPRWDRSGTVVFVRSGVAGDPASGNVWIHTASGGEQQLTRLRGFMQNGDANSDGLTNCADLALVKASFGKRQGQAGYDSRADVNGDLVVNLRDLTMVSSKLQPGSSCQ